MGYPEIVLQTLVFPIWLVWWERQCVTSHEAVAKKENPLVAEIVKAFLMLADQLGLDTVAEGIETEDQADFLTSMKCHFGQGFLFSRPMELPELERVLGHSPQEV